MDTSAGLTITILLAVDVLLLTTVMIGGEFFIRLQNRLGHLSPHTRQYFRAGYAHAGVLIAISMIMLLTGGSHCACRCLGVLGDRHPASGRHHLCPRLSGRARHGRLCRLDDCGRRDRPDGDGARRRATAPADTVERR